MLKQDPQLPFLDVALSPEKMLEFFNREVLPTRSVARATGLTREKLSYTAGRKCVIVCSLRFADPREPARRAVVTVFKDDSLQEVYIRHYHRNLNGPTAGPVVYLPEHRCLVEFFPMDWELPWLPRAADPSEIASLLGRASDGDQPHGACHPEVEVLRYRPHETCVLSYRLGPTASETPREVVGKLYRDRSKAEKVWHALNVLHSQATDGGVGIPEPLAIEAEWGLVLMERVPGASMKRLIRGARTERQARQTAQMAAAALAAYHELRFDGDEVRSFATEMEKLRKRAARLDLVAPLLAREVDRLLRRLEPQARFIAGAPTLIHGDCKPSQFLIEDRRVSVVDFDRACRGDPAIDVGSFMAQLHREALSKGRDHLHRLSAHFLAEYQKRSPFKGLDHRARVFQVLSLVRMAVRKFEASPQSYGRKGVSSDQVLLLKEAASCLSEL